MSEYISIEPDVSEDGRFIQFQTNLPLSEPGEREQYDSPAAMDEGSPVAQCLAAVGGILTLVLHEDALTVTIDDETDAHTVIADVAAALRDFFL